MRIYRSNPFNAVGRLPNAPRLLAFAAAVAVGLGVFAVWAEHRVRTEGAENLRAALAARGHTEAEVEIAGRGAGCGRARRLYAWRAAGASGAACVGPRTRVEFRPAATRAPG